MDVMKDVGAVEAVPTTGKLRSRGRVCKDCSAPIAKGARLRCRPCAYVFRKFSMPEDFERVAGGLLIPEIMAIYDVGKNTVQRWRIEAGILPLKRRPAGTSPRLQRHPAVAAPSRRATLTGLFGSAPRAKHDGSRAAGAAQFLQQFGPVYRCDDIGRADFTGRLWRRGSAVLTDSDLIDRAEHKGWQPDAWRQVVPAESSISGARA